MPLATTFDAIRSGIVDAIVGITPSYTPSSTDLWRQVYQQKDVPSVGLRSFFVDLGVPVEDGEVFGGCARHRAELRVWTSYGDMPPGEAQVFKARDHQDLWRALHRALIDGAPKFEKVGFESQSEDGRIWGAHVFEATLFLPIELT